LKEEYYTRNSIISYLHLYCKEVVVNVFVSSCLKIGKLLIFFFVLRIIFKIAAYALVCVYGNVSAITKDAP